MEKKLRSSNFKTTKLLFMEGKWPITAAAREDDDCLKAEKKLKISLGAKPASMGGRQSLRIPLPSFCLSFFA